MVDQGQISVFLIFKITEVFIFLSPDHRSDWTGELSVFAVVVPQRGHWEVTAVPEGHVSPDAFIMKPDTENALSPFDSFIGSWWNIMIHIFDSRILSFVVAVTGDTQNLFGISI